MQSILRTNTQLPVGEQLKLLGELRSAIVAHSDFLSSKHRDGQQFVDGLLASIEAFKARADEAIVESSEAKEAVSVRAALYNDAREHIRQSKARAKMVAEMIEDDEGGGVLGVTLLRDYGVRGNQLGLSRTSHVERLLARVVTAHQRHGALMQEWGVTPEFIARGEGLRGRLAPSHDAVSKERGEAELAVQRRNEAEEAAVKLTNRAITLVETFQSGAPRALADFQSVLNKYRAKLTRGGEEGPAGDGGGESGGGEA